MSKTRAIYTCATRESASKDDPTNVHVEADVDKAICDIMVLAEQQHKVKVVEIIDEQRLFRGPRDTGDDEDGDENEQEDG